MYHFSFGFHTCTRPTFFRPKPSQTCDCHRSLVIFSAARLLILGRVMFFGGYLWPVPAHMAEKVYENQGSSHPAEK